MGKPPTIENPANVHFPGAAGQLSPNHHLEYNGQSPCSTPTTSYPSQAVATTITTVPSPPSTATQQTGTQRRFPSDLKTIKCTYPNCPKTFNRPARLAAHLRSHNNDRAFRCPFQGCDKDYLEEKHLKQHIKGSHTQERNYICPEPGCDKSFVTATRLRRHAAVHEGKERYRCRGYDGCDQSFRKHQTLQRHVRTEHLGLSAYICAQDGCGRGFDTAGAMKRHMDREHGELRFWCDECAAGDEDEDGDAGNARRIGFTTLSLLQAHLKKEHVNCIFCDARCGSQAQLDRHVEMYHSVTTLQDRKTVACEWPGCPKTFTLRKNLNAHVKTAHEGFRFVCGQVDTFGTPDLADWNWKEEGCNEGFISKMKLEEHVRFVHLGRKRPQKVYDPALAKEQQDADFIAAISGVSEQAKRNILCEVEGCEARFIRHADLIKHQARDHPCVASEGKPYGNQSLVESINRGADGPSTDDSLQPLVLEQDGVLDPRLQGEDAWYVAAGAGLDQQGKAAGEFEQEWADMRRLIDLDAFTG